VALPVERARQRQLEFTADASHELRTPLSVIEAHSSLALAREREPSWDGAAFGRIDTELKRTRRLVDDMLWLARFDSTGGMPQAEPVDVAVLAAQTADRFAAVAETRGQQLEVRAVSPGADAIVTAAPEWLDRLVGILLDNACKYSPEGGTVTISVVAEGRRVRLTVADSGPGIPETERGRVFDRFHRATDQPGGSGLGLAIADAIVRSTGGRWHIGTSPEGGANITVTWPRYMSAP
jgi:two-component system OmpR family sensor kinase